jgi:hypothetical protein
MFGSLEGYRYYHLVNISMGQYLVAQLLTLYVCAEKGVRKKRDQALFDHYLLHFNRPRYLADRNKFEKTHLAFYTPTN